MEGVVPVVLLGEVGLVADGVPAVAYAVDISTRNGIVNRVGWVSS